MQGKSIGYDKADLVQIRAEGVLQNKAELLFAQLKAQGAITHGTTLLQSMTSSGNNTWNISWPGKHEDERILFDVFHGGFDLTRTTGMKLIAGREFSKAYPADTAGFNLMVNEAAVKVMNLKDPIGAKVKMGGADATIIGVYKDFVWDRRMKKYDRCIHLAVVTRLVK